MRSDRGIAEPRDIRWVNGGLEEPGRHEKFPLRPTEGVVVESATAKSLSQMLAEGEVAKERDELLKVRWVM